MQVQPERPGAQQGAAPRRGRLPGLLQFGYARLSRSFMTGTADSSIATSALSEDSDASITLRR